ncbi:GAF domain-containing sensor histidine kinase [Halopseudomonas nanhaiensis]|uniref:GAF domain-containing sensor histidine kinase n=1 Tax=Halopseudomonas nanhaiensis TaxID=2830842 RepID=UPI001CBCCC43|nr:GAF domain-containing sensor histidine kinase [Halopseudomonas nanhaiensis]UAW98371.1 GAF domain-containing sensor histidine kinase [Halopseudomonas nanhaiensis]
MHVETGEEVTIFEKIAAVPRILEVICRTTGMGFVTVARVTENRWVACQVLDTIHFGLKAGEELDITTTLCQQVRQCSEPVVIENVETDPVYAEHATPAMYGFQSYVSMPIRLGDGSFFGTLCAIHPHPVRLKTPETLGMLELFAELIGLHLDNHLKLIESEASLSDERSTAKLREEFIAVLGHDLRNPLASIKAGTASILRSAEDARTSNIAQLMLNSIGRMESMISNVLDFARGRLGSGLAVEPQSRELQPTVMQVVEELRTAAPVHRIETDIQVHRPVRCDHYKLAQVLSNLVGNAVAHGNDAEPIRIVAALEGNELAISVSNAGEPVPEAVKKQLFEPFYRRKSGTSLQGLGLGLYISAEIARAHGGTLDVVSDETLTTFTLRLPNA